MSPAPEELEPALYLVATPIGNLGDITARAVAVLRAADVIACEDTRRTRQLLSHLEIRGKRLIVCGDHNERHSADGIAGLIAEGRSVALCSDAGAPSISDPGYRVVRTVRDAGGQVLAIPGASAVTTAISVSGLPPDRYLFAGFGPRKPGRLQRWLDELAGHGCTVVVFEAPQRLPVLLAAAERAFGDVEAAVCIELTKLFEEVAVGSLGELAERFTEAVRGEVTVVIGAAVSSAGAADPAWPVGGASEIS